MAAEVKVLNPKTKALHRAKAASVQQGDNESLLTRQVRHDGPDFISAHDHGQANGFQGTYDLPKIAELIQELGLLL